MFNIFLELTPLLSGSPFYQDCQLSRHASLFLSNWLRTSIIVTFVKTVTQDVVYHLSPTLFCAIINPCLLLAPILWSERGGDANFKSAFFFLHHSWIDIDPSNMGFHSLRPIVRPIWQLFGTTLLFLAVFQCGDVKGMDMSLMGDMGPDGMDPFQQGVAAILRKHSAPLPPKGTPFKSINGKFACHSCCC